MLEGSKISIREIRGFFKNKYYISAFTKMKNQIKDFSFEKIYQIKNLFSVNLDNGLNYLYKGNFRDAKIRFKIMNFIWKNNPIVHYNLGRVFFFKKKNKDALNFLENSSKFFNESGKLKVDFSEDLPKHFIKKIRDDEDIFYVPHLLKKEQYNFSLEENIANSFKTTENLKILSSIFNHYIWIYKKDKNLERQLVFLEIGSGIGELGEILRVEYQDALIDGIDFSEKQCEFLNEYEKNIENGTESHVKIYNEIKTEEMHEFLINNLKNLTEHKKKKTSYHIYDVIFSMGTFGEFGQLGVILNLCESNLENNGLLVFYVYEGDEEKLEFKIFDDYFCYNLDYINFIIKKTNFVIEFIDNKMKINDKNIIFVILRKNFK